MPTFLTDLPEQIGGSPGPDEQKALKQLRRVVKLLEKENSQLKKDCESKLEYQRKQEQHLREENERLRVKVNDMSRPSIKTLMDLEEYQSKLNDQSDTFTAKLELDKRQNEALEREIESISSKIDDIQDRIRAKSRPANLSMEELETMGYKTIKEGSMTHWLAPNGEKFRNKNDVCRALSYKEESKVKKKLAMLEGRMQKTLIRFNESLVVNKKLREEIEHLRKERLQFDRIHTKMESLLFQKKTEIANTIEVTNVALETRDEAQKKIKYYQAELLKNQQEFDAEWRKLDNEMESEEKRRRQVKARIEDEARKLKFHEDDAAQKAQLHEITSKYEASKADLENFERAFTQLQEATGLKDIDELVETFLEAENQNFKLFRFVNELNKEEERLTEEVNKIKREFSVENVSKNDVKKLEYQKEIEEELARVQAKAEDLLEREEDESSKVQEILKIIRRMYEELGCSKLLDVQNSFQCEDGHPVITDNNMMFFLGIIEQRASELIYELLHEGITVPDEVVKKGITLSSKSPLGLGPAGPVGASLVKVQPPKIDTDDKSGDEKSDDEEKDDDARPLTQEELRTKMKRKIAGSREFLTSGLSLGKGFDTSSF
ncbi:hypothetical protein GUITHDRAFT_165027 [Guillardia theta CCMP2712]|uniref:ODAD1 central coiled coil region domain-containing protein n=2 Tax=Guillardia theta TaxID=55529 RepID=L1ISI6_GUITC|nr:hypothetical protein GUITHDRAFT_165027 [Guillardia theta CCMP2712]EKX39072.1 hypothetical protein GUITHDRAFT_165027 [Guillardia theta CCMP2712]|mmetsp:Transcript_36695/g.114581  ORF Transcript_36695/g.114581 Transcript_36695/m.114581 type:complete len:606 (+) Transcript_36695:180-1997(+)|eukprot:XP_005826052.1 hypothetical protein GUITHDRAFT_165027 [Guillardia theta CCMP2712]